MPQNAFSGSKSLLEILGKQDWSLHNILQSSARLEPLTWDELEVRGEASVLYRWDSYILLPQPQAGESYAAALAQARNERKFPVLRFKKDEPKLRSLHFSNAYPAHGYDLYFLTHLILKEDEAVAISHPLVYPPYSSRVSMPLNFLVPVFTKHFSIATFTEKGELIFKVGQRFN